MFLLDFKDVEEVSAGFQGVFLFFSGVCVSSQTKFMKYLRNNNSTI